MIIRSKHDKSHPYLSISMKLLRDRRLTSEERDCLIMMLSNVDDWEFSYQGLATQLGIRRETVKTRVQSLIEKGYVSVSYPLGENGKPLPFAKGIWEIREEPIRAGSTGTIKPAHTCPVCSDYSFGTSEQALANRHEDLDTTNPAQRNTEGIKREQPTKNQQIENQQSDENEERENQVQSLSPYPFPNTEEFFSGKGSSEATASPLQGKKPGLGEQVLSQTDLAVEQAFNHFCDVYPNLGDRDLARAAFLAIPDIGTICHQVANSVEWFEHSGKWDNWKTGEKNVSCPGAVRFLKEGRWKQYLKSGATMSEEDRLRAILAKNKNMNN